MNRFMFSDSVHRDTRAVSYDRFNASERIVWADAVSARGVQVDVSEVQLPQQPEVDIDPETSGDDRVLNGITLRTSTPSARNELIGSLDSHHRQLPKSLVLCIQELCEPDLLDQRAEELLDEIFTSSVQSEVLESELIKIVEGQGVSDDAVVNILSAYADYGVSLKLTQSIRVIAELMHHKSSFVAVAALQVMLCCVCVEERRLYIETALAGKHERVMRRLLAHYQGDI